MLPLTFADPSDYDKINPDDRVDLLCTQIDEGKPMTLRVHPKNGSGWDATLNHTFNASQIEWFKNGSALNAMAKHADAHVESGEQRV